MEGAFHEVVEGDERRRERRMEEPKLGSNEVRRIMKKLKKGKAAEEDDVRNEV